MPLANLPPSPSGLRLSVPLALAEANAKAPPQPAATLPQLWFEFGTVWYVKGYRSIPIAYTDMFTMPMSVFRTYKLFSVPSDWYGCAVPGAPYGFNDVPVFVTPGALENDGWAWFLILSSFPTLPFLDPLMGGFSAGLNAVKGYGPLFPASLLRSFSAASPKGTVTVKPRWLTIFPKPNPNDPQVSPLIH